MTRVEVGRSATCPPNTQWYVCSRGSFQGCCSADPCTSGVCLNSNMSFSTTRRETDTNTATTTTRAATTSMATTTADTEGALTTSSVASTSSSATPTSTTLSETTSPQPPSATDSSTRSHHSRPRVIGGIAGGVAATLVILGLIVYLVYCTRKKRGKRFTLLRWRCGPRAEDAQGAVEAGEIASAAQTHTGPSDTSVENFVLDTPVDQSESIPGGQSLTLSSQSDHQINPSQTAPSHSSTTPGISPKSTLNSKVGLSPIPGSPTTPSIPRHPSTVHPAFRQHAQYPESKARPSTPTPFPTSTSTTIFDIKTTSTKENPTSTTTSTEIQNPSHESTPELFDTGFYRGRVELSATPSRELINIPYTERLRQRQLNQIGSAANASTPVITPDGAILTANFNQIPVDPDSHAMSFMQFDAPSESAPPVYQGRQREGSKGPKEPIEGKKEKDKKMRSGS
ncbi:uncharacterized protein BJX67DRAFT_154467 [Aspergillus lucknowensis]|uniref:Uncharacterized protein n=1 Tax=Aspergillus lucknowensis TaxID=176173 RepID=A0ABR4LMI6_9EURO